MFVNEKLADSPGTVAVTMYGPAVLFAVKTGEVATPAAVVTAVTVVAPPAKLPLAPVVGAVNVTVAPLTTLPPESFTVACSAVAKAALI